MNSSLAMNAYDLQGLQYQYVTLLILGLALLGVLLALGYNFLETMKHKSRQKTEQYRLDVQKAQAERDQMVITNRYRKLPDGSLEPTERKSP